MLRRAQRAPEEAGQAEERWQNGPGPRFARRLNIGLRTCMESGLRGGTGVSPVCPTAVPAVESRAETALRRMGRMPMPRRADICIHVLVEQTGESKP